MPDPFETNRKSTVGVPLAGLVVEEPALGPPHAPARHVLQRHRRRVRNVVGEVQAGDLWAQRHPRDRRCFACFAAFLFAAGAEAGFVVKSRGRRGGGGGRDVFGDAWRGNRRGTGGGEQGNGVESGDVMNRTHGLVDGTS